MTAPFSPVRSERGIALIIVLLLLAVISAMATGLTVNSQTEIAMATNEAYYAGARAAAEAGMNRIIEKIILDTTHDMLNGEDAADPGDNGLLDYLLAPSGEVPPYAVGDTGEYTYTIRVYDDDDPVLYGGPLSSEQLLAMGVGLTPEDGLGGSGDHDVNDRMILQVTGFGPQGTKVVISRILENDFDQDVTPNTISSNPALLVNGDLALDGNIKIQGTQGNVHANGDLDKTGVSGSVTGDMTASGTLTSNDGFTTGGMKTGGAHTINVPDITAAAHQDRAQYKLTLVGGVPYKQATALAPGGATAAVPCGGSCNGFTWNAGAGRWDTTSGVAGAGTFYIQGPVKFSATAGPATFKAVTVIATGSIEVDGRNFLKPSTFEQDSANGGKFIQFVTDGDLKITGNSTLDDATAVEGQSLVREQLHMFGTPILQGRILVQDVPSVSNLVTTNYVGGTPTITYNGSLGPIVTDAPIYGPITYTNNVSGWLESQ
jgi:hypothetical protein